MNGLGKYYFEVNRDHIVDEIVMCVVAGKIDGQIYVEHNGSDSCVKVIEPQCIDLNESNEEDGL